MDFFQQQDTARRNTRLLVVLFSIAVALLIILTNAVVSAFLHFNEDYNLYNGMQGQGFWSYFSWERFGFIGLVISAVVGGVVLFKWLQLSTGGKVVAESLGGTRIVPQSRDRAEQRCLNVVEELALAANMPVPPVYVLNGERGINAFAAGVTPADAIVAVTRGTIEQLKRHELQGVIAHEFSHILNGDMRLSTRLAAMLKGITFVGDVGHFLLRGSSRARTGAHIRSGEGGAGLHLLGLALWILGWLGGLAAGFIKAAISRQKEFLADASAVQFTRSTQGIADALKVIGGYVPGTFVHAARASEMSHIFFGDIKHSLWQPFATHPPLPKRIQRIEPRWDGKYIERTPVTYASEPSRPGHGEVGVGRAAVVAAAMANSMIDASESVKSAAYNAAATPPDATFNLDDEPLDARTAERENLPLAFVRHAHEPLGAQALVFSLLMAEEELLRQAQLALIDEAGIAGLQSLVTTLSPGVAELGAPRRLPLLELCLPALKAMSLAQYRVFKRTLIAVIQADKHTELYEWCLFQLVRHYLDPEFVQIKPSRARFRRLKQVLPHVRLVLSVLAHASDDDTQRLFALAAEELEHRELTLVPREKASVAAFSEAVHELADCYPLIKPRLLKAMVLAANADGELCPAEREVIASIAAVMDCPVPSVRGLLRS